ncbi:Predicted exporter protein, RND superfamily [Natronoarchaeum philippinense]|uniref:Predicted exporter protein, RND superfamily n=1 Tax=Natronoarchaeum philippinense TaxID=558529 RepID=A0A285NB51_NATPI|nr:MMPL family transporter [Natronoarchaeum philippinense]SNZ06538.1 Predicted exporter protein, RND superfamily [Natronoarchaeum philippinense]
MNRGPVDRYADALVEHSRLVIVVLLAATLIVGAGAALGDAGDGGIGQFETESEERAALDEIEATYGTDDAIVTQIVVRDEGGDVLTKESLLDGLELQQELRTDDSINSTLQAESPVVGVENVVATAAYYEEQAGAGNQTNASAAGPPTIDQQIAALSSRSDAEVESLLDRVLDPETETRGGDPYQFLPSDYQPGSTTADARITFVFQTTGEETSQQAAYDAQLAIDALVEERFDDAFVFGQGITDDASTRAVGDSFTIITPVALVLVLGVLAIAYRDVVDVLIGVFGIAVVMVWLAGIQGWLEIPSSQLLIAVPFLLIGLSIDYSLHVVMRYREAREGNLDTDDGSTGRRDPTTAMRMGVAGVAVALAAATFSTGIGFLSNYVSPLVAIQDFALLSAGGILAAFIVFTALVPAVKVEVERLFDRFGRERRKPAVGVSSGRINRALSAAGSLARRAPIGIVVVAVVLASVGAYGATGIDTEFNRTDFLPEDAPDWAESLPGPLAPGEFDVRQNAEYLGENFRQRGQGAEAQVLIRGSVTDPAALTAIESATSQSDPNDALADRPGGAVAAETPVTVLRSVAAENESLAAAIDARDSDGDGLPDEDVAGVYDVLFDVAPEQAAGVLYRTDGGDYESARLTVGVQGDASAQTVADDVRAFAASIEANAPVTAVATGGPVVTAVLQDALLETLIQALAVTIVVIGVFLTGLYWWRHGTPEMAAVTLAPVVLALAWLLGTMALFDVPFNSETAVVTSLAIGLGVDYSIHFSERFVDERRRRDDADEALAATIAGTGGALLGSAATTAIGFGVLALALAPPLQRFGIVTGLSIIYAFVACITVLPSLLVLRERALERFTSHGSAASGD